MAAKPTEPKYGGIAVAGVWKFQDGRRNTGKIFSLHKSLHILKLAAVFYCIFQSAKSFILCNGEHTLPIKNYSDLYGKYV